MSNERAKFEEWSENTFRKVSESEWLAWQASRASALEEAVNSIKFLIIERGSCTNLCHRDCIEEIRSLAEAPTKEK